MGSVVAFQDVGELQCSWRLVSLSYKDLRKLIGSQEAQLLLRHLAAPTRCVWHAAR